MLNSVSLDKQNVAGRFIGFNTRKLVKVNEIAVPTNFI